MPVRDRDLEKVFQQVYADLQSRFGGGINEWMLLEAVAQATGRPPRSLSSLLGQAREFLSSRQVTKPPPPKPPEEPEMPDPELPGGASESVPGVAPNITGFDPSLAAVALSALGAVPTAGLAGTAAGLAGQAVGQFGPAGNLTATTPSGPVGVAAAVPSGNIFGLLAQAMMGNMPTFTARATSAVPDDLSPTSFTPTGPFGWTDPTTITARPAELYGLTGDAPPGGAEPGAPSGGPAGAGPGAPGPGSPGGGGTGEPGEGQNPYRGGSIKGKPGELTKKRVHGGEFVVNHRATEMARPALEALNAMVPPEPRSERDLAAIVTNARKFFDVPVRG